MVVERDPPRPRSARALELPPAEPLTEAATLKLSPCARRWQDLPYARRRPRFWPLSPLSACPPLARVDRIRREVAGVRVDPPRAARRRPHRQSTARSALPVGGSPRPLKLLPTLSLPSPLLLGQSSRRSCFARLAAHIALCVQDHAQTVKRFDGVRLFTPTPTRPVSSVSGRLRL